MTASTSRDPRGQVQLAEPDRGQQGVIGPDLVGTNANYVGGSGQGGRALSGATRGPKVAEISAVVSKEAPPSMSAPTDRRSSTGIAVEVGPPYNRAPLSPGPPEAHRSSRRISMSGRTSLMSKPWRVLRWAALAAAVPALWACTSRTLGVPAVTPTQTVTNTVTQKINNDIDILFMVDNSSSMNSMQQKLYMQLPTFMGVLEGLPMGLPSVHIAVVSSDMGAPSDVESSIECTATGDNGAFQVLPRSEANGAVTFANCTDSTLAAGAEYITDDAAHTTKNFTAADISTVFQCIALLGSNGCGFEHQLASIDHALGSDNYVPDANGVPQPTPPATNVGFIRPGAYLGIVMLTNEDDCSAPANTTLFSENGGQQSITNPLGPIANYRCNQFGHVCLDPTGPNPTTLEQPPLNPPADAKAGPPQTLPLTNCESNDTMGGLLTPVSQFVSDIQKLKPDPLNQILVAAVTGPPSPYTVEWEPGTGTTAGELWPQVEHVCGPTNDGSFADPAVRITQFVQAFGGNGLTYSICDPSYATAMQAIATKLGELIKPKCVSGTIQTDAMGQPNCTVTNHVENNGVTKDFSIPNCAENGNTPTCWNLAADAKNCPNGGQALSLNQSQADMAADSLNSTIQCETCVAGVPNVPGCP
jgi:hypothetical protein